jgi:hypothetical protein
MTTSENVRDYLKDSLLSLQTFSNSIYTYEVVNFSEFEAGRVFYENEVNFWEIIVSRRQEFIVTGYSNPHYFFDIKLRYTLEHRADVSSGNLVTDRMETLVNSLVDNVSKSFGGLIDFYTFTEEQPAVEEIQILDRPAFRATISLIAQKQDT